MQRHLLADVANNFGKCKQHVLGISPLYFLAVEADDELQLLRIDICFDPRPYRRECICALGSPKGPILVLPGAVADVVAAGVSQDEPAGFTGSNTAALLANDRHRLSLVMNFARRIPRQYNRVFVAG